MTWSILARSASSDSTWALTLGSVMDGVPFMTTCTLSPDWALKLASSRFCARVDSVLGALKLVVKLVPAALTITWRATKTTNQAATTHLRWV